MQHNRNPVRDHIPLEQGLRLNCDAAKGRNDVEVRDHIPLEQGLRLRDDMRERPYTLSQRPYSIRTRIKTNNLIDTVPLAECQRPYSIRTRIKTTGGQGTHGAVQIVRDHIPLEQGLRQFTVSRAPVFLTVRDHIPLEQGFRLITMLFL